MLLLSSQGITAQGAVLSVRTEGRTVLASVSLASAPIERVLTALHEGLKSEIVFDLRLYLRQKGFLAWLGDRPVVVQRESRVAVFDLFTRRYVIQQDGRAVAAFSGQGEFLRNFFVLSDYPVGKLEPGDPSRYYLLARVRLSPVRIVAPLNIVTLFSSDSLITTDWVEQALGSP